MLQDARYQGKWTYLYIVEPTRLTQGDVGRHATMGSASRPLDASHLACYHALWNSWGEAVGA
jgi:hypothetical protein